MTLLTLYLYDGIEIDMLSIGDADCIVVTRWSFGCPSRVLVDGGCGSSYDQVIEFLLSKGLTSFEAAVCTHCHNDHAAGLIKLVKNPRLSFQSGWMHNIRNHVGLAVISRAKFGDDEVRQVVETTNELEAAFKSRSITPREPFVGATIGAFQPLIVLGPSVDYYRRAISDFMDVNVPAPLAMPVATRATTLLGGAPVGSLLRSSPFAPPKQPSFMVPPLPRTTLLAQILAMSSVKNDPKTQPFNNTSTILGLVNNGRRYMLTADAGADALDLVPNEWSNLAWMQVSHHGSEDNLSQTNIARFCPEFAFISAKGDTSHPAQSIVNGLIKVNARVFSTHQNNNLCYYEGSVPPRAGYGPATPMLATGGMKIPSIAPLPLMRRIVPI